ncbi:MAG: 30S ribosomal protein S12 methylthiotransferase RimO [Lachnospiraceae bacterium]|nr:30S ribosomal protein S12 methylthiotransferase RimO [Lachnospiraceae bacterium]
MKLLMVSLGCDKNLVDSEKMLGSLTSHGYTLTDDEQEAEIAVVNTCCFIEEAKKESIENILDVARLKQEGKLKALVVTGCMAQRYREEILEEFPEVDSIVGTTGYDQIAEACDEALKGIRAEFMRDISDDPEETGGRVITTGGFYSYLKIAEGCDKNCTYCAIPSIRGHYRSVPMEKLLKEARELAEKGVEELILVAQDTTLYGQDLYGEKSLHRLLKELCEIDGFRWIRILYCYPEEIYPELISTIASEEKIVHYLDLPIQHASDSVLKRMNRRTNQADIRRIVETLRGSIPDIVLRTTLITGFPGETEEDHEILKEFISDMKFDRLGVFTYSKEEDTPASRMKPQITKAVKLRRQKELMQLQQGISLKANEDRVGRVYEVMVEGRLPEEGVVLARTYGDTPQVDGYVFINTDLDLMTGQFVKVLITEASEYDLIGEIVDESAE